MTGYAAFGIYVPTVTAVPNDLWRWENFTPREIASKGDGSLFIVPRALDALQRAREAVGEPFRILSAFRDPAHNKAVGGASASFHMFGLAFDIALAGHDLERLGMALENAGFTGFGLYERQGFLHADLGPRRRWGFPQTHGSFQ